MSRPLFREDSYLRQATGQVIGHTEEGGLILDRSLFYPTGGGQPGDSGQVEWSGGRIAIATAVKGEKDAIILVPDGPQPLPSVGTEVTQTIDWDRRYRHMRVHTGLHLLSVVIPLPVTGGQIGENKGRLDFNMPQPPEDVDALQAAMNALIARDLPVTDSWITDAELAANPGLVKTMSVTPPTGQGRVRLVRIGSGDGQIDLQPCGGTHVARTGEIGQITLGKIENKGKQNRRVNMILSD